MFLAFGFFIYIPYILFLYPVIDVVNYYILYSSLPIILFVVQGLFLIIGIYLFVHGLVTMIHFKHKQSDKILIKTGLYKYIRHPQNLGILLISFAFILYVPWMNDIGIRSGDLLSWILFFALTSIKSLLEESHMIDEFGEEYLEYASQTGFYFPKITQKNKKKVYIKKKFMMRRIWIIVIQVLFFMTVGLTVFALLIHFRKASLIRFPPPSASIFPSIELFPNFADWIPSILLILLIFISLVVYLIQYFKKERIIMEKEEKKQIIVRISKSIGTIWAFIGLIAGVLFPMLYIPLLLSSSWVLFASIGEYSWANMYLKIDIVNSQVYLAIYTIEGFIFLVGLSIFCLGLGYLVKGRNQNQKLVTNGPYKYIRHPQNLGILLMCLPFAFYSTNIRDPGIRFGDVLSWVLMVILLCISALIEEKLLINKIGEDYVTYRKNTGFFLPKLRRKSGKGDFTLWKSVVLLPSYLYMYRPSVFWDSAVTLCLWFGGIPWNVVIFV